MVRSRFKVIPGFGNTDPAARKQNFRHLRHGILPFFLAFGLVGLFLNACTTPKEGPSSTRKEPEPGVSLEPTKFPSHLLPSFEVTADSCYAFLRPDEKSSRFGPLMEGENLKWLDEQGAWIRVWIPRLRTSGWVPGEHISESREADTDSAQIPAHLLSTVTVIVKKAHIRDAPTTQSPIMMVAKRNQQFWLLKEEKGWYQVWLPHLKQKGWISGNIVARLRKE
jgi:hypothetical protein